MNFSISCYYYFINNDNNNNNILCDVCLNSFKKETMFVPVCLLCKHSVLRVPVISTSLISDYKAYFGSPDGFYLRWPLELIE